MLTMGGFEERISVTRFELWKLKLNTLFDKDLIIVSTQSN